MRKKNANDNKRENAIWIMKNWFSDKLRKRKRKRENKRDREIEKQWEYKKKRYKGRLGGFINKSTERD